MGTRSRGGYKLWGNRGEKGYHGERSPKRLVLSGKRHRRYAKLRLGK